MDFIVEELWAMYHQTNPNLIKLRKYSIITLAVILLSLVIVFFYNSRFHIVKYSPDLKSISIVTPRIEINTNKALSKDIKVTIDGGALKSYEIVNKRIVVFFNLNLDQKQYTITISNLKDTSGDSLSDQKIKFNATIKNVSNVTQVTNPEAFKSMSNYDKFSINNPVLSILPFTGPNFEYYITYDVKNSNIIFNIYYDSPAGKLDAVNFLSAQNIDTGKAILNYIYGPVP